MRRVTRKIRRGCLLLVCLAFSCSADLRAQSGEGFEPEIASGREIVDAAMVNLKIPGMSVAVAVNGKMIWSEGFGFADLENKARVSPATRFRIASVSKLLTAAALARLYEQGKIDLDAPIQTYVPDFPRQGGKISARQLAGHLSGIRHYRRSPEEAKDEFFNRKTYYRNISEAMKIFRNDPLDFEPGTRFGYSSYGYTLLSAAIENASGQDFLGFVRSAVLDPLEMRLTCADDNRSIITGRTRFYSLDANKHIINAPYIDSSDTWAGGGFLSTSEDLVRFGSAFLKQGLLKQATLDMIFTSQKTSDGKETGTGIGWRIKKDKKGRVYYFHPGENVGGRSYLVVYPRQGVVVAMLNNLTGASLASVIDISTLFADAVDAGRGRGK